jgi:hypothetical protein
MPTLKLLPLTEVGAEVEWPNIVISQASHIAQINLGFNQWPKAIKPPYPIPIKTWFSKELNCVFKVAAMLIGKGMIMPPFTCRTEKAWSHV